MGCWQDALMTATEKVFARQTQVLDLKKAFAGLDESIPLLCCCGNHDVGNAPNKVGQANANGG